MGALIVLSIAAVPWFAPSIYDTGPSSSPPSAVETHSPPVGMPKPQPSGPVEPPAVQTKKPEAATQAPSGGVTASGEGTTTTSPNITVRVPSVVGESLERATLLIQNAGFILGSTKVEPRQGATKLSVLAQTPAGHSLAETGDAGRPECTQRLARMLSA